MNPVGGSTGGVNPRSTEAIDRYNSIAVEIMEIYLRLLMKRKRL